MPELPEVETICRQLQKKVKGLGIKDMQVKKKRLFKGNPKKVIKLKIKDVRRRAKIIIIDLVNRGLTQTITKSRTNADNDLHLLIHLKMTGQLIYADKKGQFGGGHPVPPFDKEVPNKYTHIIFKLSDGSTLYYNDLRQFGWIKIVSSSELEKELEKFGPEPLDKSFTFDKFKKIIAKKSKAKVKPTLMDQSIVAGLGNIYSAEVCFRAGIMPDRIIKTLNDNDIKKLYQVIKKVLALAIKYKGTSADAYVTLEGERGEYRKKLWVYGREGQPCPKCGRPIKKMKLAGRGTYFCDKCQK